MDATPLAFTWIGRGWTWVGLLLDGTSDGHPMIWSWESEFIFYWSNRIFVEEALNFGSNFLNYGKFWNLVEFKT
jgi:hypothetical protein